MLYSYRVITEFQMQPFIYVYVNAHSPEEAVGIVAKELCYDLAGLQAKQLKTTAISRHLNQFGMGCVVCLSVRAGLY